MEKLTEKEKEKLSSAAAEILDIASDFTDEYTTLSEALEAIKIAVLALRLEGIEFSLDNLA